MQFTRYGIYFTPSDKSFADAGARWLGWDIRTARHLDAPEPAHVARPRKYGFHATLKPPFKLADGTTEGALISAAEALTDQLSPVDIGLLEISRIGSFFALTSRPPNRLLQDLAAQVVRQLDRFRAATTEDDIKKRVRPGMPDTQIGYVKQWGYPYVMEFFEFHMTLTGSVAKDAETDLMSKLQDHFEGRVPDPVVIDAITLVGERADGMFSEIARLPLRQSGA